MSNVKRIRVKDGDFAKGLAAVKAKLAAMSETERAGVNTFELLSSIVGLTPDSAKQRLYSLIREPDMVEKILANGKKVQVNKGGKGLSRDKVAFMFNGTGSAGGTRKNPADVAAVYEDLLADESSEDDAGE